MSVISSMTGMCAEAYNNVIANITATSSPLYDWSVNAVLANVKKRLISWGALLMMIIGVVMIIVGIFKIAQGLISHGKTQVNWVVNILLIIIGALFCAGATFFKGTLTAEDGIGASLANDLNSLGGN